MHLFNILHLDLAYPDCMTRKKDVRNWTLYVIRFSDQTYYVGITAHKNYLRRINQHGGYYGARWNHHKQIEAVIEVRHLGQMKRTQAERIENNVTHKYRRRYGRKSVRGGYYVSLKPSIFLPFFIRFIKS